MNDYSINVGNLIDGDHSFEFKIDDTFFQNFTDSEIKYANINSRITLIKRFNKRLLSIKIKGTINRLLCDICTEEIDLEINEQADIIIKTYEEKVNDDSDENIIYMNSYENELSIKYLLFELITLSIPKKRTHKLNINGSKKCNKQMLDLIKEYSTIKSKNVNPIWEKLKNIK
jgi:hypothetical protein